MCALLSSKHDFLLTEEHSQAFTEAKAKLVNVPTLAYFSLAKETRLCTDASRQGLGFVLQQLSEAGPWNLIQAGSWFLTPAESQYAVIELELLAVTWVIVKCHVFLDGLQHFTVVTDHNPLIPIHNSHHRETLVAEATHSIDGLQFYSQVVQGKRKCSPWCSFTPSCPSTYPGRFNGWSRGGPQPGAVNHRNSDTSGYYIR